MIHREGHGELLLSLDAISSASICLLLTSGKIFIPSHLIRSRIDAMTKHRRNATLISFTVKLAILGTAPAVFADSPQLNPPARHHAYVSDEGQTFVGDAWLFATPAPLEFQVAVKRVWESSRTASDSADQSSSALPLPRAFPRLPMSLASTVTRYGNDFHTYSAAPVLDPTQQALILDGPIFAAEQPRAIHTPSGPAKSKPKKPTFNNPFRGRGLFGN